MVYDLRSSLMSIMYKSHFWAHKFKILQHKNINKIFLNRFHCTATQTCVTISCLCKSRLKMNSDILETARKLTHYISITHTALHHILSSTTVIAILWSGHTNVFGRICWNNKQTNHHYLSHHKQLSYYRYIFQNTLFLIRCKFNCHLIFINFTLGSYHCSIFQYVSASSTMF
jgi:hypothetical protein